MKTRVPQIASIVIAAVLCIVFGGVLTLYATPMQDVSMDLSLALDDAQLLDSSAIYDTKGWTVFTREGDMVTKLEPDGFGGYLGIELGETFYFSRVMSEELDSPTLQLATINRTFAVWLDDALIYTDCPELDNRVGYLTLPMREWDSDEPIILSLPMDYQGKTLTIAQSSPAYTEGGSVRAYPASVKLYCGYAYESELISESFAAAILAAATFAVGVLLLLSFVRTRDYALLSLALVAFFQMTLQLSQTSFYFKYFGNMVNSPSAAIIYLSATALLPFLASRAGKYRGILWCVAGVYILSVCALIIALTVFPTLMNALSMLLLALHWIAFVGVVFALLGGLLWGKHSWFYRFFTPLALVGFVANMAYSILFVDGLGTFSQIALNLRSGSVTYLYFKLETPVLAAALFTALAEAVKLETARRLEKRLVEEHTRLALESYENMRRQHEEVMMIRHDMGRHFRTLQDMSSDQAVRAYLTQLIGQNQNVRPVVQSGNEMLDIILNSKLSAAAEAGIKVEIVRTSAPEQLPISDADLSSLVMNIVDNAITAASGSGSDTPFLRLDVHEKNGYFTLVCENSANIREIEKERKKETVPKHGLGLKIIRGITQRYHGLLDTQHGEDYYKVRVAIPLA